MVTTSTGNRDGRQGLSIGGGVQWEASDCMFKIGQEWRTVELDSCQYRGKHFISTALKYEITQHTRMTEAASASEYFLVLFSKLELILGPWEPAECGLECVRLFVCSCCLARSDFRQHITLHVISSLVTFLSSLSSRCFPSRCFPLVAVLLSLVSFHPGW